jgi:putative transposase
MKRHDANEIAAKLRQADDMIKRGQSQKDVCKELGVSVMTFHRWRKMSEAQLTVVKMPEESVVVGRAQPRLIDNSDDQIHNLKLENQRLRRIVSDLLLEKMKVQEALEKSRK